MKMIEKNAGFAKKFRRVVFAFFALASGFSCFAFDFGALVKNDSALEDCGKNDFKLNQKNSASVWVRAPFEKSGENHFAAEFVYNFEADLQNENYQNAFLTICDQYDFLVNYDAVVLTAPEGIYG